MFVHGDFYKSAAEVEDVIHRLVQLKEAIEPFEDTDVIDESVDILYEVIENGN